MRCRTTSSRPSPRRWPRPPGTSTATPTGSSPTLREALAAYLRSQTGVGITPEQVWAGNGSNEVLLHLVQAFGGVGRTALGFTPAYSMHPIITRTTGTTWVDGLRGTPSGVFDLDAGARGAQVREHRAAHRLPLLAEQPDRHGPVARRVRGRRRCGPGLAGRRGRGLRRVRPPRHAERDDPARGPAAARRHPDHEQGVRPRRRPGRLPRRRPRPRRRAPAGADALPPVRPHPGRRARGDPARRQPAGDGRGHQGAARPHRRRARRASATHRSPATRTSSSTAASPTPTRRGRRCSTGASWSATSASRTTSGSPPARPHETVDVPAGHGRSARLAPAARTRPQEARA